MIDTCDDRIDPEIAQNYSLISLLYPNFINLII